MKIERTTKMYNIRMLRKIALQMKIDNIVKIIICFVIFLSFSYVWILFQSCVDLYVENSNIDFWFNLVRIDFDVIVMSNFFEFWMK
jgi:hypothetical protein